MNVDYYDITVTNSILVGGIPLNLPNTDQYITDCFVAQIASNCANITRNSGGIFNVQSLNANTGTAGTTGVDMEAAYSTAGAGIDLPFDVPGALVLDAQAEHQITNFQETFGLINNFAGTYLGTSGYAQPKWKATFMADYNVDMLSLHYDLQYIGGTDDAAGGTGYGFTLPDMIYHNISAAYDMPAMGPISGSRISIGINNLMDKDPPFTVEDGAGKNNTISGPYDEVRRFFYTRFTFKL